MVLEHKTALEEQARRCANKLGLTKGKQITLNFGSRGREVTFVDCYVLDVAKPGHDNLILSFEEYDSVCRTRRFIDIEASNLRCYGRGFYVVKDESRVSDVQFAEGISVR